MSQKPPSTSPSSPTTTQGHPAKLALVSTNSTFQRRAPGRQRMALGCHENLSKAQTSRKNNYGGSCHHAIIFPMPCGGLPTCRCIIMATSRLGSASQGFDTLNQGLATLPIDLARHSRVGGTLTCPIRDAGSCSCHPKPQNSKY